MRLRKKLRMPVNLSAGELADLGRYVPNWWTKPSPTSGAACFARKTDALKVFLDHNLDVTEPWGMDRPATGGEFDAVNERYGLRGKRRVTTLARALWEAMPPGAPYCIDKIDLGVLNETSPALEAGGFRLPDVAAEHRWASDEARYYRDLDPAPACGRGCRPVTWKRRKRGEEKLPERYWKTACLCKGRKRKAGPRCRVGGDNWRELVKANIRAGKRGLEALDPAKFTPCDARPTPFDGARRRVRGRR